MLKQHCENNVETIFDQYRCENYIITKLFAFWNIISHRKNALKRK